MLYTRGVMCVLSICLMTTGIALAEDKKAGPADGFNIHVMAPHKFEDGTVHGPYHHYRKGYFSAGPAMSAV